MKGVLNRMRRVEPYERRDEPYERRVEPCERRKKGVFDRVQP